jgi:aryl-alcohol dehydrogenase-like predicted oxidoreductase
MHHVDRECPVDEICRAFGVLVAQGKVIYVGSSNFAGWDIATFNLTAQHRGSGGLVSEQSVYHLDNRTVELEVVPACRHYGLGIIPWSPLGGGLLGGALQKRQGGRRGNEGFEKTVDRKRPQLEKYEALCKELELPPATVALAWLLHNPVVTAPIIGPRTMDQLANVLTVPDVKLSPETMRKLDEIWPGPGGEAPKAYAW